MTSVDHREGKRTLPNVLTIAGSDPSGGAGIQGDLRTFAALGVYGCAVVTALTAQSTRGARDIMVIPSEFVARQLDVLLDDVAIDAVKVGMLGDAAVVRAVVSVLRRRPGMPTVVDPVMRASTGAALLDDAGVDVLRDELMPLASVITPNAEEAGVLLGRSPPRTLDEATEAAMMLIERGAPAALVTGGHYADEASCADVLAERESVYVFRVARVTAGGTHGTGCALSSAIAALLALGRSLPEACAESQRFVAGAIRGSRELSVGRGTGPVNVLT